MTHIRHPGPDCVGCVFL